MKQILLLALLGLCTLSCRKEANIDLPDGLNQIKKDSTKLVELDSGLDTTITGKPKPIDGTPDWRDPLIGKYEGSGRYTNYQTYVTQGVSWTYYSKVEILKDTNSDAGLIIRRDKMTSFKPDSWVQDYFVVSLEYKATLDKKGILTISKQEVKTSPSGADIRQFVIYDRSTDPKGDIGSYGQFNKDTLNLWLVFSNVSIVDSTVLIKK